MIIVLKPGSTKEHAKEILKQIESVGLKPLFMPGTERTVLGAIGDERKLGTLHLENHPVVDRITPILTPFKLVSREMCPSNTVVDISGVPAGGTALLSRPTAIRKMRYPTVMNPSTEGSSPGSCRTEAHRGGVRKGTVRDAPWAPVLDPQAPVLRDT